MIDCIDSSPRVQRPQWLLFAQACGCALAVAWCGAVGGCGRHEGAPARAAIAARTPHGPGLAVDVHADNRRSAALAVAPPAVSISVARVAPAPAGVLDPPLPPAAPDSVASPEPHATNEPARLLPPILRRPATVVPPPGLTQRVTIYLEVRVDVQGRVIDVQWAGGAADSSLVRAARECAATMAFYPALMAGKPIEVWCRQRFDFAPR